MSLNKLYGISFILSLLVLGQSVFILGYLTKLKNSSQDSLPQIFLSEGTNNSVFTQDKQKVSEASGAALLLDLQDQGEMKLINIWLETPIPVSQALVRIIYNPEQLDVLDQMKDIEGIQIGLGQASKYLQNNVKADKGEMVLAAEFGQAVLGKVKLGTIYTKKINSQDLVSVDFDFVEGQKTGSFVLDLKQENILKQIEGVSL